jgi:predicted permease
MSIVNRESMSWWRKLPLRFRALFQKRKLDAEMEEEMRSHIEMQTQENISTGMNPDEARYAALRQFGWVESIKETCRKQREGFVSRQLSAVSRDLRIALRYLLKNPGSTVMAVLILALGIGGTTAVFSVADKVLLNPIPGRSSEQMVIVREVDVRHDARWNVSPPLFDQLSAQTNLFESLTYFHQGPEEKKIRAGDGTVKLRGATVAPNFFDLLGVAPSLGRRFLPGEGDEASDRVIVISRGLWQEYLGGVRDPIGKSIELDGIAYTVVGVMPPNVQFPFGPGESQFWIPHVFTTEALHSEWAPKNRFWSVIGRLREGVTIAELQAVLDVLAARRQQEVSEPNQRWAIQAEPGRKLFGGATLEKTLWTLQATIAVLLVITCANVGNLLLSRASSRRTEFAIRMAVGAGRLRLARQLLTESLSLAGLAVAFGVFVAWGGIKALEQFYLSDLPRLNVIGVDWRALITACLVAAAAGVFFGTAPAWAAARTNMNQSLKESAQQQSGGSVQRMLQDGLVVIQTSLAVLLVIGAVLMIQSTVKLLRVDPGLDPQGLYRACYDQNPLLDSRGLSWPEHVRRYRQWHDLKVERLRSIPGIESAAISGNSGASYSYADYQVEGIHEPVQLGHSEIGILRGDYFRTLRLPVITGRLLNEQDCIPGQQAVVINQELANRCWPGQSPLGKRISYAGNDKVLEAEYVVVGVVKDMLDWKKDVQQKPTLYIPVERITKTVGSCGDFMIRSDLDPDVLRDIVIRLGKEMLPSVELRALLSIEAELSRSTAPRRVMMWLLISLGGLGLLLSALGVYAVLAYAVARRTREVGIRMAMGAGRSQIRSLFLRHGIRLVANGLVLGTVAAVTAAQYVRSLLYGVEPADPWAFGAVLVLLGLAAGLACWLPARRAARVNPMEALRYE